MVVNLPATDELNAVEDPVINASVTSNVTVLLVTAVVIGPAPVNVNASVPTVTPSLPVLPEIASTEVAASNDAISDAIDALVDVNDPDIAVLLAALPVKVFKLLICA